MTEPDVAITDYALCVLCLWMTWSLWKQNPRSHRTRALWMLFFFSIAAASFVGGTVHGFFLDEASPGSRFLWPMTLLLTGVTASTTWMLVGVRRAFAIAIFLIYATVVIFVSQDFKVVILNYLPAMIALLAISVRNFARTRAREDKLIATGLFVGLFAAIIQQAGIAIHSTYFNHNSTYHLLQAFGIWMLYLGARIQIARESAR